MRSTCTPEACRAELSKATLQQDAVLCRARVDVESHEAPRVGFGRSRMGFGRSRMGFGRMLHAVQPDPYALGRRAGCRVAGAERASNSRGPCAAMCSAAGIPGGAPLPLRTEKRSGS